MSRPYTDRIIVTVGWLQSRLNEGMYAHGAAALKDFGDLCRKRAGEAYGRGDDKLSDVPRRV